MAYVLVTARGHKQGLAIPVRRRVFVIGSLPSSDVRSCQPGVGPRQCALVIRKKEMFLQDLQSGHPTQVNGTTVPAGQRVPLKLGDRLAMGPMEFILEQRDPSRH